MACPEKVNTVIYYKFAHLIYRKLKIERFWNKTESVQKIQIIIYVVFFQLFVLCATGQVPNTLYFMKEAPQASFLNPAFSPEADFVVGLPLVSGVSIGFNNNLELKNVTEEGCGILSDTLRFDFNSFYDLLGERGKVNFEANASMLFVGIKSEKRYYSISVNEKAFFRGSFDKKFVEYFKLGSKEYYGSDSGLGSLDFDIAQYREFAFAFSEQSENKKLVYGARMKLLFGRMNMSAGQLEFQLETSAADESLYLVPSGAVDISGPIRFETDTVERSTRMKADLQGSDYIFNFRNLGLAGDLGFDYKINQQASISASLIDLGFIRFAKKNFILDAQYALEYPRDSLTQTADLLAPDYMSGNQAIYAFRDSIPFMTTAEATGKSQYVVLPMKLYLGASLNLNKDITLGFLQKLYFQEDFFNFVSTVSAQALLSDGFAITGSCSVMQDSYFNLGLGGSYKTKVIHVYFATDNIFSLAAPSSVKNLNLQFGINLFINSE